MSANFTGVTFAKQKVTPSYDGIIRRALLSDGTLTGCEMSYSGSTLTMSAGQLLLCGRQIVHPSTQNWAVTEQTSGFARLVLTIDLTRTSTKETFDQVVDSIQYATSVDGFTALEQTDINTTGTKYQVAACVVSLGTGGITGIVSQLALISGDTAPIPNLLDNSDFAHFVAQVGVGGNHGTQAYAGDRWILDSGSVTGVANANGDGYSTITLNGTIRQIVANPPAGAHVCAVEMVSGTATIAYDDGEVTITSSGGVIKNAGLYAGSRVPKYVPKGYQAELAECLRYYYCYKRYKVGSSEIMDVPTCSLVMSNDKAILVNIPLSEPIRVVPTVRIISTDWNIGGGKQTTPVIESVSAYATALSTQVIRITLGSALSPSQNLQAGMLKLVCEFSADL